MNITENQRLKILQNDLGFKTQKAFADALGIQQGSLSDIYREKEGVKVSNSIKFKLENLYNVNIEWLENEIGKKFKSPKNGFNEPKVAYKKTEIKGNPNRQTIPVYTDSVDDVPAFEVDIPQFRDCSFGKIIQDNAMAPVIPAGAYAFFKPVTDKFKIVYGSVYYIEFDNYQVLRRLKKGDKEGEVLALADNMELDSDGTKRYQSFNIPISKVNKIYLSKGIIRLN